MPYMSMARLEGVETPVAEKLLLTVEEAAQRLGITRSKLYVYVMAGTILSVKIGKSRRIPTHALDAYVERLVEEQVGQRGGAA